MENISLTYSTCIELNMKNFHECTLIPYLSPKICLLCSPHCVTMNHVLPSLDRNGHHSIHS